MVETKASLLATYYGVWGILENLKNLKILSVTFQKPVSCWGWGQGHRGTSSNRPMGLVSSSLVPAHCLTCTSLLNPLSRFLSDMAPVLQRQAELGW